MLSVKAELLCMYNMQSCIFLNIDLLCESVKLLSIDNNWIFRLFILMCYLIVSFCFFLLLDLKRGLSFLLKSWRTFHHHHRLIPGPLNQRNLVSVLQQRTIMYIWFLQTELYGTFNSVIHTPHSSC